MVKYLLVDSYSYFSRYSYPLKIHQALSSQLPQREVGLAYLLSCYRLLVVIIAFLASSTLVGLKAHFGEILRIIMCSEIVEVVIFPFSETSPLISVQIY